MERDSDYHKVNEFDAYPMVWLEKLLDWLDPSHFDQGLMADSLFSRL